MIDKLETAILRLREKKPLILNLTNLVTMDFVANCLLAMGAAPMMSGCEDELEELIQLCSALYLNLGTLNDSFITLGRKAVQLAHRYKKPLILDPVGAGASQIRTQFALEMAPFSSVIRGNASEIFSLKAASCASPLVSQGVEAVHAPHEAQDVAFLLARSYQAAVIVSGGVDMITDGVQLAYVPYGSLLMQKVTGMGCALTAVVAAFRAVEENAFTASWIAASYVALCGQLAERHAICPGSFKTAFIDQLHAADFKQMRGIL
ncbi:MAG: hydroxyethylthiazole kinase [Candidatus Rhabdochlamydia sp.]